MALRLELLSPNMILIINKSLENQTIAKLVKYNDNPLAHPDIADTKSLFFEKVFPFPFANVADDERTELRIYFPECDLSGGVIEKTDVWFDIVTHKNLYLIKDADNNTLIRNHKIAQELIATFDEKSIGTVGRLHFRRILNLTVDENFQGTRLIAEMMTIGESKKK